MRPPSIGALQCILLKIRDFSSHPTGSSRIVPVSPAQSNLYCPPTSAELPELFDAARPDLVLVQAGVDPHRNDRLGLLALSDSGLVERDLMVRAACIGRGVPFAATMGGGYGGDLAEVAGRHVRSMLALATGRHVESVF